MFKVFAILLVPILAIETFKVDLDRPPEERWADVATAKKQEIIQIVKDHVSGLSNLQIALKGAALKMKFLSKEYRQEAKGIAKIIGQPFGHVMITNFMYEEHAFCTSIVARQPDGTIVHGRNSDYDFLMSDLRNITVNIDFYRGGKFLYSAVTYAGLVGLTTAIKPGAFSISLNERKTGTHMDNVIGLWIGHMGNLMSMRNAMETCETYSDAVLYLAEQKTIASSYFIIAGMSGNEGAVITRARNSAVDVWSLTDSDWYLVETNYDHWEAPPPQDDRRTPAIEYLENLGQKNINALSMSNLIGTFPTLNPYTIYSTVMIPTTGYIYSILTDTEKDSEE